MAYEPKKFSPAELAELHALPDDALVTAQEASALALSRPDRPEHPGLTGATAQTLAYSRAGLLHHVSCRRHQPPTSRLSVAQTAEARPAD